MSENYAHIVTKIVETVWLITPDSLATILNIVDRRIAGEHIEIKMSEDELLGGNSDELELPTTPSLAVLPIQGPILPKANMMARMSGATSASKLASDFTKLVDNPNVTGILLDIDSPGGASDYIEELGDLIYDSRDKKPIYAIANTMAASAALWLGSQASKFYGTKSGKVGSLGAYTVHDDLSGALEKAGIKKTIISAGRFKVEGNPYEPPSDEYKDFTQERINELHSQFVGAVARGRGKTDQEVLDNYGGGRLYPANHAMSRGMIDGIKTFDQVVAEMRALPSPSPSRSSIAVRNTVTTGKLEEVNMRVTARMLEALGLSEEATDEDIESAVVQMSSEIAPLRAAAAKQQAFAEMFPEEAARLRTLEMRDREKDAQLFAQNYAQFTVEHNGTESVKTGFGFSAVVLSQVENIHKQITAGDLTHDEFKGFLDCIANGSGIVDYREVGTTRGKSIEGDAVSNSRDAAAKLAELARTAQAEAGGSSKLSWGDAIAKVSDEHPELAAKYNRALRGDE